MHTQSWNHNCEKFPLRTALCKKQTDSSIFDFYGWAMDGELLHKRKWTESSAAMWAKQPAEKGADTYVSKGVSVKEAMKKYETLHWSQFEAVFAFYRYSCHKNLTN